MHELPLTLKEIKEHLAGLPGFKPEAIDKYFSEDVPAKPAAAGKSDVPAKPAVFGKRLFFKVQYRRGEAIIAQDSYCDYAALHLQGLVRFWKEKPPPSAMPECWDSPRPWRRWLGRFISGLLPSRPSESVLGGPNAVAVPAAAESLPGLPIRPHGDTSGKNDGLVPPPLLPVADRLMGVTGALWHRQRSGTLLADDDGDKPCVMLLIKRKALEEILAPRQGPKRVPGPLYRAKIQDYLETTFPEMLQKNRLFRPLFYVEDVKDRAKWAVLVSVLSGKGPDNPRAARLRELLDVRFRLWIAALDVHALDFDDAAQYRVVSMFNTLIQRDDLYTPQAWPDPASLDPGAVGLTSNERMARNRLLVEAAFPAGTLRSIRSFKPATPEDFTAFAKELCALCKAADIELVPERFQKSGGVGDWADRPLVFDKGAPADGLYFILSGKFMVTESGASGALLNHLDADGFFGESCIGADENATRRARVAVLSNSGYVLKIDRRIVVELGKTYPDLIERLRNDLERSRRRDEGRRTGLRPPPPEPPQAIATRLALTTNLLLIDMDRCTRCDQCVKACSDAHQDRPRFHRANPDLRIGKWEVAGACLHCSDAPCLEECPVGAITFIENGAVQIHRDRCIGCTLCAKPGVCPFGVIEMLPPATHDLEDGRSLGKKPAVATKCDLCLTRDRQPPCVVGCPYGAAVRGRPEDFFPDIKGWATWGNPE